VHVALDLSNSPPQKTARRHSLKFLKVLLNFTADNVTLPRVINQEVAVAEAEVEAAAGTEAEEAVDIAEVAAAEAEAAGTVEVNLMEVEATVVEDRVMVAAAKAADMAAGDSPMAAVVASVGSTRFCSSSTRMFAYYSVFELSKVITCADILSSMNLIWLKSY